MAEIRLENLEEELNRLIKIHEGPDSTSKQLLGGSLQQLVNSVIIFSNNLYKGITNKNVVALNCANSGFVGLYTTLDEIACNINLIIYKLNLSANDISNEDYLKTVINNIKESLTDLKKMEIKKVEIENTLRNEQQLRRQRQSGTSYTIYIIIAIIITLIIAMIVYYFYFYNQSEMFIFDEPDF